MVVFVLTAILGTLLLPRNNVVQAADNPAETMGVSYSTHVQKIGWQGSVYDGQLAGTTGLSYRMEGIEISLDNPIPGMKIQYQTHVQSIGWQNWVSDGALAGTTGKSLRLEAIKIKLEGAPAGYHIQYSVHVQNIGWQNWVSDGALAGTTGKSLRLEAIKIRVVRADSSIDSSNPGIKYQADVQNIGWQDDTYDGQLSGTMGNSYMIEALKISLNNALPGMKIKYQTSVQSMGWLPWVYDGQQSGAAGQALRVEAVRIALEGAPTWMHVKYKAYVQGSGWQDWVSDGQTAGTEGQNLRIEAIRILIYGNETVSYTGYNISLNDMMNSQMTKTPAMQMKNSSGVYEWRYAKIENGQKGYYIVVPKKDANGNYVLDSTGEIIYNQVWTNNAGVYDTIRSNMGNYLDPNKVSQDPASMYEFLKLSYVDGTTADQLNSIFSPDGVLAGKGQVFIDAAKAANISPIYLAAHAILETGNGTSNLARGIVVNGETVYDLFGIQAVDSNPDGAGSQYAYSQGWYDGPNNRSGIDNAIYGGAQWMSSGYINNPNYKQDTLYKMRWYPDNPSSTHLYATDISWAYNQTTFIEQCFEMFDSPTMEFEIPVYTQ